MRSASARTNLRTVPWGVQTVTREAEKAIAGVAMQTEGNPSTSSKPFPETRSSAV